jgi:uncharacterized protein (TIGR02145 family)
MHLSDLLRTNACLRKGIATSRKAGHRKHARRWRSLEEKDRNNNLDNVKTYGYLYTWVSAKKACPSGWHLASKDEWSALSTYLGGESTAAEKLKEAGTDHWQKPVSAATNETGFNCLPGGFRNDKGEFYNLGLMCFFWCSTEEDTEKANHILIFSHTKHVTISYIEKNNGFSVRCVKD